ncbi:MFS transporter [Actinoplanes sp. NPDC026619]|uniref:MFS transporter n=1 Tax=Actinoplanes sp. NPDC026619 TaxID=3155798 RepID=UPI0033EF0D6E
MRPAGADRSTIVVALLITLTVHAGCTNYGLPLYLEHLTTDRGLSLSGVSAGTSVFFIAGALAAAPMGVVLTRVDPRTVMAFGGVLGGASLGLLGQAHTLWHAYACYAGMGAAFTACGYLPGSTAVLRLTPPGRRARSLAVSSIGLSAGGFVVTPISSVLLDRQPLGTAMAILGVAYAVITTTAVLTLMPRTKHATPDTGVPPVDAETVPHPREVSFPDAVRSPVLWLLTGGFVLFAAAQIGATTHIVRLATGRGLDPGVWLVPLVTLAAVGGRVIAGLALSRMSLWTVVGGVFAVEVLADVTLGFASSVGWLAAGAVLLGIAIGHTPVVQPLTAVEAFGVRDYARIAALFQLVMSLGLGAGPLLVSLVHDGTAGPWGGYRAGYLVLAGCAVGAVVVLRLMVAGLRRDVRAQPVA